MCWFCGQRHQKDKAKPAPVSEVAVARLLLRFAVAGRAIGRGIVTWFLGLVELAVLGTVDEVTSEPCEGKRHSRRG